MMIAPVRKKMATQRNETIVARARWDFHQSMQAFANLRLSSVSKQVAQRKFSSPPYRFLFFRLTS